VVRDEKGRSTPAMCLFLDIARVVRSAR
jgi:hypothetical protein